MSPPPRTPIRRPAAQVEVQQKFADYEKDRCQSSACPYVSPSHLYSLFLSSAYASASDAMGIRKETSFFGKWITEKIEDKKLQPTALGAANLAAELQEQNLTIIYMAATTHSIEVNAPAPRRLQSVDPI